MSKRVSKYQKQLEILYSEFESMKEVTKITSKIRLVCLCVNVFEVRESLNKLLERLSQGEPVMDECIDFIHWDFANWNLDFGNFVKDYKYESVNRIINYMQDISTNDCVNYKNTQKRVDLERSLDYILSQNNIPIDEFVIICKNGISEIKKSLTKIYEEVEKDKPEIKYADLSDFYREECKNVMMMERQNLGNNFNKWLKDNFICTVEEVKNYRAELIKKILNTEFCSVHKDRTLQVTSVIQKYGNELNENGIECKNSNMVAQYAFLRKFFDYEDDIYCINNESQLGKYIYIHRSELTDKEICEFYMYRDMVRMTQDKINEFKNKNLKQWNNDMLTYIEPLKNIYTGKHYKHLWDELISEGTNLNDGNGNIFELKNSKKGTFNRVLVLNIIGKMHELTMFSCSNAIDIARVLRDAKVDINTEKTISAQINPGLDNLSLVDDYKEKIVEIIGKYK